MIAECLITVDLLTSRGMVQLSQLQQPAVGSSCVRSETSTFIRQVLGPSKVTVTTSLALGTELSQVADIKIFDKLGGGA